jgi:hypothetical protein
MKKMALLLFFPIGFNSFAQTCSFHYETDSAYVNDVTVDERTVVDLDTCEQIVSIYFFSSDTGLHSAYVEKLTQRGNDTYVFYANELGIEGIFITKTERGTFFTIFKENQPKDSYTFFGPMKEGLIAQK